MAFILLLVSAPAAELERGLPLIRNFPPGAYGGPDQVWDGAVAADGMLFFGGNNNVLQFDGQNWDSIPLPGAAHVRCLAMDPAGVLWVGGVNELGRIDRGPDGRRRFTSLRAQVPKEAGDLGVLWKVYATDQGVWFQSNTTVLRWRDGKFDSWATGERSIVLSFWLGDHLLVALTKGWFKPVAGGKWEELGNPADKLGDYLPHFAVPHPAGGWWMGLEGPKGEVTGLARWDGAKLTVEPHPLDDFFKTKRFSGALRLADGRYVVTTLQGGAVVLSPKLEFQTLVNEQAGMESDVAIAATADASGAVWLSTEWGLSRLQLHPAYTWFGAASGLGRRGTSAIIRWQDRLYAAGVQGLLALDPPATLPGMARFSRWTDMDEKIDSFALSHGSLIAGGLSGLWQIPSGGVPRKIKTVTNIFGIAESRATPGRVFTASMNGLALWRWQDDQLQFESIVREPRGNSVAEAADGSVWLGTDNQGVWRVRFEPGAAGQPPVPKSVRLGAEAGLPDAAGRVRVMEIGGAPLFLTGRGLRRFDEASGKFRPETAYGARFGDGSTFVRAIAEDARGGVWLVVDRVGSPDAEGSQLGYVEHGTWTPLPVPELERRPSKNYLRLETVAGREMLWVLGQTLALRIDVALARSMPLPPVGRVLGREALTGSGRVLVCTPENPPQVGAKENTLRFSYGAPGLAGETNALYETRLVGFADGKPELAPRSERTFTNLPAGSYTFEARGRTADGRWTDPARIGFMVLAPWWQTPGAWAGYVVAFGLLLYGYIRWRIRRLTRERSRLEAVVAERTAELAHSNAELQRLHRLDQDEKLTVRLSEEKARLELLRYQLNPHFLYNSLNSIRALIYSNAAAAGEMVTRLSEFCRWTLTRSAAEMTTVAEEAEMLQAYLDIERTRWQDGLVAKVEIEEGARGAPLPQFLLLPLLENAIKYGGKTSPDVLIVRISVWREAGMLVCEVANTGHWVELNGETPRESTRIGLENLRERLRRYYGPACDFERITEGGWVRVRLRLPQAAGKTGEAAG